MTDTPPTIRQGTTRRPRLARFVQGVRVALVAALLLAIPSPDPRSVSDGSIAPPLEIVRHQLADAASVESTQDASGLWPVHDSDGQTIALAARTLPAAMHVVGYRGPTEALIIFGTDLKIKSVRLLDSADTSEHVEAVAADQKFFEQFQAWTWGGPQADAKIDAVSGATLTSLALAEGVLKRIGGDRPSLVFPDPLTIDDVVSWYPDANSIRDDNGVALIRNAHDQVIGRVIRSGVLSDDVMGYQGPTELLLKLSPDDAVESIRLRKSYDNEPYVDYVRTEAGFWAMMENQSLAELARLDPEEAGIEGVSGATMTSLAVADTIVATAQATIEAQHNASAKQDPAWMSSVRWTAADIATICTLLMAAILSQSKLFHRRTLRRLWLLAVVVVIGLWAGNLISMALVAGWSAEGIAWRLAPGLTAVVAVALLVPPMTKGNPYCNHLCPHGAIQQLIKTGIRSSWRRHPSRDVTKWLAKIPGLSLVVAYVALCAVPTIDLSAWEPFHAYLFRIAPWSALVFAALTLAVAAVIPMGYCRFGCPTGRLIDYLRRTATSDRIQWADYVATGLLLLAITIRLC